jgi:hypothetical protein
MRGASSRGGIFRQFGPDGEDVMTIGHYIRDTEKGEKPVSVCKLGAPELGACYLTKRPRAVMQ